MKLCQGGPNLRRGGSISVRGFGRGGGQNPRGVQIRYDTGIFETLTDIDDFTICPTHIDVGQSCGSNSRCRVPKEVSGYCNMVRLSRFQKPIGKLASVYHRLYSRCLENSYSLAPVSRLLTTVSKITHSVRLKSRLGIGQQPTKNPDRGGVFYTNV